VRAVKGRHAGALLLLAALLVRTVPQASLAEGGPCLGQGGDRINSLASPSTSPRTVAEGPDWFTLVLGRPRDMSDPAQVRWFENLRRPAVVDGVFRADLAPHGKIWLLYPGFGRGAFNEPDSGAVRPVDADVYRRVAFRAHVATDTRYLWWGFHAGLDGHATLVGDGWLQPGWRTYVDLLRVEWRGAQQGLALVLPDGAADLRLDWARLLPEHDVRLVTVSWQSSGLGAVDVLVDDNRDPSDGFVHVAGAAVPDSGEHSWSPDVLPPGRYFTMVRPTSGGDSGVSRYGPAALRVEPIPILRFASPSALSGDDYATLELGNAWDMDGPADLMGGGTLSWAWQGMTSGPAFQGGLLHGETANSDPYFYLNVDPARPIDTGRYRYLSWRWRVEAPALHSPARLDHAHGLMTRFHYFSDWPYRSAGLNTLDDVVIWDGWNTYTVDLHGAHLDDHAPGPGPGWRGTKAGLRFDPLEGTRSFRFWVDWVRLTADPVARSGSTYPLRWSLRDGGRVPQVRLYLDTDDDWSNGTFAPIARAYGDTARPPDAARAWRHSLYLPYTGVRRSMPTYHWQVPSSLRGRFFIVAEVDDGLSTTRWYSEVPVNVVP